MIRPAALVLLLAFPALAPIALATESAAAKQEALVTTKSDRGTTPTDMASMLSGAPTEMR
ncbi:MAG: hypothetical protein AAF366_04430 [Pseudomonadota bacterium]